MPKYLVDVMVQYLIEADSWNNAQNIAISNTEFPVVGVDNCYSLRDEIIKIEEMDNV